MPRKLRDYSYKRFSNPMFERRHQPSERLIWFRRVLSTIIGVGLLGGAVWGVFWSGFFTVKTIAITGNNRIASWEIEDVAKQLMSERALFVFPKSNVLILSENDLRTRLTDRFVFAAVDITKRPPDHLDIKVRERVSSILLKMPDGNRAVLDLDGTVLRLYRPDEPDPEAYLLQHQVFCDVQGGLALREIVADAATVSTVINAPAAMVQVFTAGPTLKETHLEQKGAHTLRLVTSEGWMIYVDSTMPLVPQLQNAATVLKEKVGNDRSKLDYIDARFGDKIFFKLK